MPGHSNSVRLGFVMSLLVLLGAIVPGAARATHTNEVVRQLTTQTQSYTYNRTAAANWALKHAQDPEPFSAACAYFVSQALWAGGLPKSDQWTSDGHHGFLWNLRPGTPAATAVDPLRSYLTSNFSTSWTDITSNLTTNAVPQAEVGDIIVYDWEGDGKLDHMAFVVSIQPGQYPNVSEWGTVTVLPLHHESTPYQQRGWTWSELKHKWLQQVHGTRMRAYLLHFNDPAPTTPPAAAGRAETSGGILHTWTNYASAGGNQGPSIAAHATVQVACKVTGFRVSDGNTWWYRIQSAPWNGAYYASADGFYNNGQTSGSLHGTPFVDPTVPDCGGGGSAPPPPPPPPPPSRTWPETTGGVTHTWTNYSNAGGNQGPSIAAFTTVQIACKVTGFRVADGNTWWYRIQSSPWSNSYYASADAFYNNGQTSGSLHGTPFVDPAVPNC